MALTEKKKKFADRWFETLKGGESAGYSGYSKKTADQIAYNLLQEPEVQEYIQSLRVKAAENHSITKERWLSELEENAFSNVQDFISDDNSIKDLSQIDRAKARALNSVKKTVTEFEGGSKTTVEFKLNDKLNALDKIGRHFGWFEKDNIIKNMNINVEPSPEEAKKIKDSFDKEF